VSPRRYYASIGDTLSGFADFLEKRNVEGRARREREGERAARLKEREAERAARAAEREADRKENLRRHKEEMEWRKARKAFELGTLARTGEAGARQALEGASLFGIEPPPGTTEVTPPTFAPGAPPSVGQLSGPELGAGRLPLAPGRPSYEYEDIPAYLPVEPPPPPPPMPVPQQQAPTAPFGEAALQGLAPRGLGAAPAVRPLPGDLRQLPGTEYGKFGSLPPAPDPTVGGEYLTALLGETPPDLGFRMGPTQYPTQDWIAAGRRADVEGRVKKEEALIEKVLDGISTTSRSKGTGGVAMEIDEFRLSKKRPTREDVKRWQEALAKERAAEDAAKKSRARASAARITAGRRPERMTAQEVVQLAEDNDFSTYRDAVEGGMIRGAKPGEPSWKSRNRFDRKRQTVIRKRLASAKSKKYAVEGRRLLQERGTFVRERSALQRKEYLMQADKKRIEEIDSRLEQIDGTEYPALLARIEAVGTEDAPRPVSATHWMALVSKMVARGDADDQADAAKKLLEAGWSKNP